MDTFYRVDFVLKAETDYARTEAMLDRAFDCGELGIYKRTCGNTISYEDYEPTTLKTITDKLLGKLLSPCFICVLFTDEKNSVTVDLLKEYNWDRTDKHEDAVFKCSFIMNKLIDMDKVLDEMNGCIDSKNCKNYPVYCSVYARTIEFYITDGKYEGRLFEGAMAVIDEFIPDCFTGAYWYDLCRGTYEDLLEQQTDSMELSGIDVDRLRDYADDLPNDIVMQAVFTIKDSEDYLKTTEMLDTIFKCLNIDYHYEELGENMIAYISEDKRDYFGMHRAAIRAASENTRRCFRRITLSISGEGCEKEVDVLSRAKSDSEINSILVKRDAAIECAASVTGFIYRNYDLNHVEYPQDIAEIDRRNFDYMQNVCLVDSEQELDRILAQIKADYEYVRKHTPEPHR